MKVAAATTRTPTLAALLSASSEERSAIVRAAGDIDTTLIVLGDEAEKLAVADVSGAIAAGEMLIPLADDMGGGSARSRIRRGLAQARSYAGDFDSALALCLEATEIALEGGDTVMAARARLASIHALGERGRYEEAIEAGEAARSALTEAGRHDLAARADLNLGVIRRKANDPAAAVEHFDRARPHFLKEPVILAQLESNRGEALLDLDRLEESEQSFRESLRLFEGAGFGWGAAIVEGNLADLASRQGRLDRALFHFENARAHVEGDESPTHLARLLVELGDAKAALGMLDEALADYEAALPTLDLHEQPADLGRALAGKARTLLRLGQLDDAREALDRAMQLYRELNQGRALARLSLLRSELCAIAGQADDAMDAAEYALAWLADHPIDAAIARFRIASLLLEADKVDDAAGALKPARVTAEETGISPLLADILHLEGRVELARGNRAGALDLFRNAVEHVERVRAALQADRFRAAFLGARLAIYESRIATLAASEREDERREAFEVAESAKSRSLLDLIRGALSSVSLDDEDGSRDESSRIVREFAAAQARLNHHYRRFDERSDPQSRAEVERLERRVAELESRVASSADPDDAAVAGLYAATATIEEIRAHLPEDAALIEYIATEGALYGFVLTRDSFEAAALGDDAAVREMVRRFRFQIGRAQHHATTEGERSERLERDISRASANLYDILIRPFARTLQSASRLIIVPHGALHLIPFAALHDGSGYLLERFEIAHAPSATTFVHLKDRARRSKSTAPASLVVGVADALAPQMRDEARAVAAMIDGPCVGRAVPASSWSDAIATAEAGEARPTVLIDDDATVERVTRGLSAADLVHFACHGRFVASNPLASGLRLADRWFTVRDLYQIRLPGSFIALSGCETGVSGVQSGDELAGLVRAFFAAGASTLAVSFWSVRDDITLALMQDFFGAMTSGAEPGAAMRHAQRNIMKSHRHPAFWAPFVLMGRPSP